MQSKGLSRVQPIVSQRVRHDASDLAHTLGPKVPVASLGPRMVGSLCPGGQAGRGGGPSHSRRRGQLVQREREAVLAKGQGRGRPAEVRSSCPEVPTGFRVRREGSAFDCGVWFSMRTGLPAAVWTGPGCGRSECSVRGQGWPHWVVVANKIEC